MSLGTLATTSIITNGLNCDSACRGLITASLSLYCFSIEITPEIPKITGGGSKIYQLGEIQQLYKPVEHYQQYTPLQPYYQQPTNINSIVKVKMIFNGKEIEKTYSVIERNAKVIVKFVNVINNINIKINNLIKTITNLKISNLKRIK